LETCFTQSCHLFCKCFVACFIASCGVQIWDFVP
jgi:hypothetical protein